MPRGKKKTNRKGFYFDENEQNALIAYLNTEDVAEKNRLFNTWLYPAFTKMIESIIRRYKLFTPDEEFQNTFDDTISFLMSKISHYRPETGYKAYSYCGTICKNYLLWKINQYNKNLIRNESFDTASPDLINNLRYSYEVDKDKQEYLKILFSEIIGKIKEMINNPTENRLKENDVKVGTALITVFEDWDEMFARMGTDKFNRSSIILYIQEMTLLPATDVRSSLSKFKAAYKKIKSSVGNIYL